MYLNIPRHLFAKNPTPICLNGRTIIVTGFGCDPNCEVPIRLPAYILPAISLLEGLSQNKTEVDVEIYFAENYSALLLGEGFEPFVASCTDLASKYLDAYITRFHPDAKIRILRDRPIGQDEWLIIDEMAEYLSKHGGNRVQQFAENRGGRPAFKYMAAHAWYMRDPLVILRDRQPLQIDGARKWNNVIMVGGLAEEIFYEARCVLAGMGAHSDWQSHQLFTPIGRRPTYHRVDSEPILGDFPDSIEELLGVSREIHRDFVYLLADASDDKDYFIVERRGNFSSLDQSRLQKGWDNLKEVTKLISQTITLDSG
jgi:hypothetical protein